MMKAQKLERELNSRLTEGMVKITLSVIKADIGGYVGHSSMHPELLDKGEKCMAAAKKSGLLIDYHVTRCGDDLQLIMTHKHGEDNKKIHKLYRTNIRSRRLSRIRQNRVCVTAQRS